MRNHLVTILTIVATASACASPASEDTVSTTRPAAATTTSSAIPSSTTQVEDETTAPPCLAGDRPFSTSGVISAFGGGSGNAVQISGIRTGFYTDCERLVVDLLTADGAPAGSLGLVGVDYESEVGIVRINLPSAVVRTAVADLRLDGELADRAYLVDTLAGNLALDIHVAPGSRIALRAFEVASPSRIVVDLKREPNAPAAIGAALGERLIVVSPVAGTATSPLRVAGYARASSSPIRATLHDTPDGPAVATTETTTTSATDAWNEFELEFPGLPPGQTHLQVALADGGIAPVRMILDIGPSDDPARGDT